MFMAFTNVYSLLDLFRSVNSGWGMQIALDTTFDINDRQMNMLTCGVTALEGHYHPLLSAFIPGDSESFVMYRNSWKALSAAAHALIADLQLCVLQTCPICSVIRQIKDQGPNRGNMSLPFFLSQHMGYMADYSERLEAAAVKSEIPWRLFSCRRNASSAMSTPTVKCL